MTRLNHEASAARPATNRNRIVPWLLALAAVVACLLLPAALNRHPILFPDSVGYFHSGEAALGQAAGLLAPAPAATAPAPSGTPAPALATRQHDGISTARSVYYGLPLALGYVVGGEWLLPLLQALVAGAAMLLALRRLGVAAPAVAAAIGAAAALVGGLGIFAGALMPDLFTGLMLLALAIRLGLPAAGRGEAAFWLALLLAACLFHKANVAIAAAVLALFVVGCVLLRARARLRLVVMPGLLVALALGAHAAVNFTVRRVTGSPPMDVPFVLARMVGDGTASRWLQAHCPAEGGALCAYAARMPMTTDEFLWSHDPRRGVWQPASPAAKQAILADAGAVVAGTLRAYPVAQLLASAGNFARQSVDVGVTQFGNGAGMDPANTPAMAPLLRAYPDSAIRRGTMPLAAISTAMTIAYLLAFAAAVALLVRLWRRGEGPLLAGALLLAGVVVNAGVSGVIAGVYDRYQGRVAWLVVLLALALLARHRAERAAA